MKGIVHFLSGIAVASFFPDAVTASASQSSFVLVLGGVAGLLPDTLDFRLSRFLEKPDVVVDPHPSNPDSQAIAEAVAQAVERAAATKRKLLIQLRTMRLGPDLWRQYILRFDVEKREVRVKLGPVVNTSQMSMPDPKDDAAMGGHGDAALGYAERSQGGVGGSDARSKDEQSLFGTGVEHPPRSREGRASVNSPMRPTYEEETQIDIFSGPSFALEWRNDRVQIDFIPWHRRWSHSFIVAAVLGLLAGWLFGPIAGAVTACGYSVHILEDQLGFLGSNLFFPLTRRRVAGLKLLHSGDAVPNFFTVWTMLVIILFNLDRFASQPLIDPLTYFGLAWLPALALLGAYLLKRQKKITEPETTPAVAQRDLAQEAQEVVEA